MSAFRILATSVAGSIALPLCGQQTWYVNCHGGAGVDFTDLPAAVAAANPGDRILVNNHHQPWCPSMYSAPSITKPLFIEGFAVAAQPPPVSQPTTPTWANMLGLVSIQGIPAGTQLVLSNTLVRLPSPSPGGISITHCAGQVVLEEVRFRQPRVDRIRP